MRNYLSTIFSEGTRLATIVQNPFKKERIHGIYLSASKRYDDTIYVRGYVEFKNGDTKAEQKFEANSFPELYMKIQQFCESL